MAHTGKQKRASPNVAINHKRVSAKWAARGKKLPCSILQPRSDKRQ